MFKLTTVADKIKQQNDLEGVSSANLDIYSKICDPLLAVHSH